MSNPFIRFTDYDFRHWVSIQASDGDVSSIHRLFGLQLAGGTNAWFEVRDRRNDVSGYVTDLNLVQSLTDAAAESAPGAEVAALLCRYALIHAGIRDVAGHHLPQLTARYVSSGLWTRAQALGWAQLSRDPQKGLQSVRDALRQESGHRQGDLARLALATGALILDSDNRVLAVADLASDLPPHLLREALAIVAREKNEGSRLGGLKKISLRLPPALRHEALTIAKEFKDPSLRVAAIVVVAATMDEPERTVEVDGVLADVRESLEKGVEARAFDTLARELPLERLRQFMDLLADDRDAGFSAPAVNCLKRLAEHDPEWVWDRARGSPEWVRNQVFGPVAVGFARLGRHEQAVSVLSGISASVQSMEAHTIALLLNSVVEEERGELIEIFRRLSTTAQATVLKKLVEESAASDLIWRLADSTGTADQKFEIRSAIAPILTPVELDELFVQMMADTDQAERHIENLIPCLTIDHVRQALDSLEASSLGVWHLFTPLLTRLAGLGAHEEALNRVFALRNVLESQRAEALSQLVRHLPDTYLAEVRRFTQSLEDHIARSLARAALIPNLSSASVKEIVAEACSLGTARDRIAVLGELVDHVPPDQTAWVSDVLIASISEMMNRRFDRYVIEAGFRALSRLLHEGDSIKLSDHAFDLARSDRLSVDGQVDMLMQLASAGGELPYVRRSISAALDLAGDDKKKLAIISGCLTSAHSAPLSSMLADQREDRLIPFLGITAPFLDPAALDGVLRRIASLGDVELRLSGLELLLPHISPSMRDAAVAAELQRDEDWSGPASRLLRALSVLVPYAPEAVTPYVGALRRAFASLKPASKAMLAGQLAGGTPLQEEFVEMAFASIENIPQYERGSAVAKIAPWLTAGQVQEAAQLMKGSDKHVFTALVRRAIVLGDTTLIETCLNLVERRFNRTDVIEEVAPTLPANALSAAASMSEDSDRTLCALAIRAAELESMDFVFSVLDRIHWGNESESIARVYRVAPEAEFDRLIQYADGKDPAVRAMALLELVLRMPPNRPVSLIAGIIKDAAKNSQRLQVLRSLEADLASLPAEVFMRLWREAMRGHTHREEILMDIRGFAKPLVCHFGPTVSAFLDDAIRLGARDRWP